MVLGCILGFVQIFKPLQEYAGAGVSVPLLGFGNTLWNGVKEAVDKEGFIGIFLGGFKASAAGISGAVIFGYIASWIFCLLYTSPAIVNILQPIPKTCPSFLYSIAGAATELANPVIGTSAPAPPQFAIFG